MTRTETENIVVNNFSLGIFLFAFIFILIETLFLFTFHFKEFSKISAESPAICRGKLHLILTYVLDSYVILSQF